MEMIYIYIYTHTHSRWDEMSWIELAKLVHVLSSFSSKENQIERMDQIGWRFFTIPITRDGRETSLKTEKKKKKIIIKEKSFFFFPFLMRKEKFVKKKKKKHEILI